MRRHDPASNEAVTLIHNRPTADQYLHLRAQTDWEDVSPLAVETAMQASLFSVLAVYQNRIVGCARVVGDGGLYFYVQDMIVDRDFRRQSIGSRMMEEVLNWLRRHARDGAFIGLMAAADTEPFYRRFGFEARSSSGPGMFLKAEDLQAGSSSSPSR